MDIMEAVRVFEELETIARDEILASGGSLSHHHGVGKIRRKWLPAVLTSNAIQVLRSIKSTMDPNNIMAAAAISFIKKPSFVQNIPYCLIFLEIQSTSPLYLCNLNHTFMK